MKSPSLKCTLGTTWCDTTLTAHLIVTQFYMNIFLQDDIKIYYVEECWAVYCIPHLYHFIRTAFYYNSLQFPIHTNYHPLLLIWYCVFFLWKRWMRKWMDTQRKCLDKGLHHLHMHNWILHIIGSATALQLKSYRPLTKTIY